MPNTRLLRCCLLASFMILDVGHTTPGQTTADEGDFGPVVRAYLGYLRNEQEVVDDRASRHEVSPQYYRRNSNRIHALRQMAMQIARETQNDYLPELEAVTGDELRLLFEHPPSPQSLRVGEVVRTTFKYLGPIRSGEIFYVFARLDPYEQAELMQKARRGRGNASSSIPPVGARATTRARRVSLP